VPITLPPVSPQPHTHLAFEGYQYAREHGKGNDYNHRVLQAFFVEGQDIGSIDVLTKLAGEVGLDQAEFEEALRTRKYREAHRQALRHAYEEAGISGVPAFFIGENRLEGLQSRETLERAIEEAMGGRFHHRATRP
jgi:predicted DsbA family dithiol-disulfide isomerase